MTSHRSTLMSAGREDDRPFVCTEDGCGMRFTNEDHLTVHKQKHEMSLALDVGTPRGLTGFVADQTPTPTKFLKNCEEIGLFQDLNKNPFDDAFKRATEAINGTGDGLSGMPGPSSLDTPVLPSPFAARHKIVIQDKLPLSTLVKTEVNAPSPLVIADEGVCGTLTMPKAGKRDLGIAPAQKRPPPPLKIPTIRVTSPAPAPETTTTTTAATNVVALETSPGADDSSDISVEMLDSETMQDLSNVCILINGQLIPLNNFVTTPPEGPTIEVQTSGPAALPVASSVQGNAVSTKERLKAILTGVPAAIPAMDSVTHDLGVISSVQSPPKGPSPSKRARRSVDDDAEKKRQHFLERNRAAAARCRNKRKMQIEHLQKRCNELFDNNKRLATEVNSLKDEVASLKVLLISHKDCPVTKKQQVEGAFNIGEMSPEAPAPVSLSIPASQANVAVSQLLQKIQTLTSQRMDGTGVSGGTVTSHTSSNATRVGIPVSMAGKVIRVSSQPGTYILPANMSTNLTTIRPANTAPKQESWVVKLADNNLIPVVQDGVGTRTFTIAPNNSAKNS